MTIDDESSVYVGGLPYSATEDSVRRVFNLYGSVVAVKVLPSPIFTLDFTSFQSFYFLIYASWLPMVFLPFNANFRWLNNLLLSPFLSFYCLILSSLLIVSFTESLVNSLLTDDYWNIFCQELRRNLMGFFFKVRFRLGTVFG